MTPTQRTLAACKRDGITCQVVERWNPFGGPRKPDGTAVGNRVDLFGVIDIVALRPGGIVGLQATSGGNFLARVKKSLAEPRLRTWLECGGLFEVWGWRKLKSRWQVRRARFFVADSVMDWEEL